jgi:hypothetical protein
MRKLLAVVLLIASTSQAQIFVQPKAGDKILGPWGHAFAQCGEGALCD